jgi:glutamyl-tRNA reductase
MDRIAIIGVSIHGTDVTGLERVRRPEEGRESAFDRDLADALGASELVFLATCNRVEVIYAREEGDAPSEEDLDVVARFLAAPPDDPAADDPVGALRGLLLQRTGLDAARHLFRVASSLDSLVVGEDQILGQVRDAYGRASDIGLVGPLLGPLFHHALAVGKQVRSDTELARHPISLVNLALHELLDRPDVNQMRVAVIGAGHMGQLMARALTAACVLPAVVVSRTLASARLLAKDCGSVALDLPSFREGQVPVDALVSATAAPDVVLDAETLRRLAGRTPSGRPLQAIDLAVPRDLANVDDPSVELIDLDRLREQAEANRKLRAEAAAVAERLVERKVETWSRRFTERFAADAVTELHEASSELLGKELAGLLSGRLAHLDEADRRAVERWARSTFGRIMHLPVAALKRLASDMAGGEPPDLEELQPSASGSESRT